MRAQASRSMGYVRFAPWKKRILRQLVRPASLILLLNPLFYLEGNGQLVRGDVHFQHLSVAEGLNDPEINAICEDRHGLMWFSSLGALNRFDGVAVKRFVGEPGDSTTPYPGIAYEMMRDHRGRIWIGYSEGLQYYDDQTGLFHMPEAMRDIGPYRIIAGSDNLLYIASNGRLLCFDPGTEQLVDWESRLDPAGYQMLVSHRANTIQQYQDWLYIGSYRGVLKFHTTSGEMTWLDIPGLRGHISTMSVDQDNTLWVSDRANYQLMRIDSTGNTLATYDSLLVSPAAEVTAQAMTIVPDPRRVWIATNVGRLYALDRKSGVFTVYQHDALDDRSLSSTFIKGLYRSSDGTIWIIGDAGVDYFHPDRQLFKVIRPFANPQRIRYSRGVAEDREGNFWFSTLQGIVRFSPDDGSYLEWANSPASPQTIYDNSSRAILQSSDGDIWFTTAKGINRLNPGRGGMRFMDESDGIPRAFYFSLNKSSDGTLWFGTRDFDGFYYLRPGAKAATGLGDHPHLGKYRGLGGRYFFEDSKGRYWLGTNGNGVIMYDPATTNTIHWKNPNDGTESPLIGNVVVDIKEDRNGVIWISTLAGVSAMDPDRDVFHSYHHHNGLTSNITGPLVVDSLNRVWIGQSNGLAMLDSARQHFTYFNRSDGLPTLAFPEHPGLMTSDHEIIMPTNAGYILFNPYAYVPQTQDVHVFVADLEVLDSRYPIRGDFDSLHTIALKANENFLTIRLAANNYLHPRQTQYAYKLEGFDRDWRVTNDPKIVYTNVPGGKYRFLYRAWSDRSLPRSQIHSLPIEIDRPFYKTSWFWIACAAVVLGIGLILFYFRIRSQRVVHELQSRAQLLEKEKAVVKYENLMQHLNPHFLFNSLTALSSLISFDTRLASEFLDKMSKVYRYILRNRDQEVVSLAEEMRFVQLYIDLQKTRFEDGLEVLNHITAEYGHFKIAPVTLQNLVENAIKHNIADVYSPLIIELSVADGYLVVTNNLQRKRFVETSNKQGLANMQSMYAFLSDRPMTVSETSSQFIVKIPLL